MMSTNYDQPDSTEGKVKKPKQEKRRISYAAWSTSQLSIVKYYGQIKIDGKLYVLDYKNCRAEGWGNDRKYFPDLVEV